MWGVYHQCSGMFLFQAVTETGLLMKPLHPKISFHILYTPLYTIPFGTSKENLFNNQSLLGWQSFP